MRAAAFLILFVAVTSSAIPSSAIRVSKPLEVSDGVCDTCMVAVRLLSDFLCDPAATEFMLDLVEKQVCPAMPDPSQCDQISEALVPVLLQWLRASATPADLCSSAGVCGASVAHLNKAHALHDGAECPLCQFVLNQAKQALADPVTQDKIKQAALGACAQLPAEFAPSCTDMVTKYEGLLVLFVESSDTAQACAMMGLCAGTLAATVKPAPLPLPLLRAMHAARPALEAAAMRAAPRPGQSPYAPAQALLRAGGPAPNSDLCSMCKIVVTEADTMLENPDVQASVTQWVDSVCAGADIPADWRDMCTQYADAYVPQMFALLTTYLQPDQLCEQLHMCAPAPAAGGLMQTLMGALRTRSASALSQGFALLKAAEERERV